VLISSYTLAVVEMQVHFVDFVVALRLENNVSSKTTSF